MHHATIQDIIYLVILLLTLVGLYRAVFVCIPRRVERYVKPRVRYNRILVILVLEALCTICAHYGYEEEENTEFSSVFRNHYESLKQVSEDLKKEVGE